MAESKNITQDQINDFIVLYNKDYSLKEISKKYNISANCVAYHLKKCGVHKEEKNKITEIEKEQIIELYNSNVPVKEIGCKFGIDETTVSKKIGEWGIKFRGVVNRKFTDKLKITEQDVINKYLEIKNVDKVANIYKVSDVTICTILKNNGIKFFSRERVKKVYREKDMIYDLYFNQIFSLDKISKMYNIGISCLCNKFKEWGWKARDATFSDTSIEKACEKMLQDLNLEYIKQYKLVNKIYDFYLPNNNLLIETNGDYWHGNPKFYKNLDYIQIEGQKRDMHKLELAKEMGYKILFLWEDDINNNPESIIEKIKKWK